MTDDIFGSFGKIMEQAKQMQAKFAEASEQASHRVLEGSSGAGMVQVRANGRGEVVGIKIEASLIEDGDLEMIQDLLRVAVNDALSKARDAMGDEMRKVAGGVPLPPGFNPWGG